LLTVNVAAVEKAEDPQAFEADALYKYPSIPEVAPVIFKVAVVALL
jgi:hypothetical protein